MDREGSFANNGLLDVIGGLRWVRRNIAAFGGDPDRATIFGQSAGADCVWCVMLSEGTEDLYLRSIMRSDPIGLMGGQGRDGAENLDELMEVPIDASIPEILEAQASIVSHVRGRGNAKYLIFAPHIGVRPLPAASDVPRRLREVSRTHDLLIGSNAHEVSAYIASNETVARVYRFPLKRPVIEYVVRRDSRAIFNDPANAFARAYAQADGRVYDYLFSWSENDSMLGAYHVMDCLALFGTGAAREGPSQWASRSRRYTRRESRCGKSGRTSPGLGPSRPRESRV